VADRLTRYHIDTKIIAHDLTAPGAAQALYDKIQAMEPAIHVDILVNNAYVLPHSTTLSSYPNHPSDALP
jgi:short-subunit dehydrogenase